MSCTPL